MRRRSGPERRHDASAAGARTSNAATPRKAIRTTVASVLLAFCGAASHERCLQTVYCAGALTTDPIHAEVPNRVASTSAPSGGAFGLSPQSSESFRSLPLGTDRKVFAAVAAPDTITERERHERRNLPNLPNPGPSDAALPAWTQFAASEDDLFETVVEFVVAGGPSKTIFALGRDTVLYVPLGQFIQMSEMAVERIAVDTVFAGVVYPHDIRFELNTVANVVIRGDSVRALTPGTAVWRNGELYVAATWLDYLFEVRTLMDWEKLRLAVINTDLLPVVRRIDRDRRRIINDLGIQRELPRFLSTGRMFDGVVVDWAVSALTRDPITNSQLQFGLGALVAGGSLDVRYTRSNSEVMDSDGVRFSWIRAWPNQRAIRQIRLGEFGSTGRFVTLERGVSITNAPFLRSAEFAEEVLQGEFPAGWEVELYRDGRLVGYTQVDESGRFGLDLPVQYGQNPVELVGYGPRGEILRSRRTFEIPVDRLAEGLFEYGASVGKCVLSTCEAHTNIDLRYGVTKHLTVQAGADYFWRESLDNLAHPYGSASLAVSRSLSVRAEGVVNGLTRVGTTFSPNGDLRLEAIHTWFDMSDSLPIVGSTVDNQLTQITGLWRPSLFQDQVYFGADVTRASGPNRTFFRSRFMGTVLIAGSRFNGAVLHNITDRVDADAVNDTGFELGVTSVLGASWGPLHRTFLRGRTRVMRHEGVRSWSASIGRRLSGPFRIDADASWFRGFGGLRFGLSLTTDLPGLRSISRNRYSESEGIHGQQSFEGSVLWNRAVGNTQVSNGRALGRAGVVGTVFVDANGNGIQEPFELAVPDVRLHIGLNTLRTDSAGHFSAWDLNPFENTIIEIDSLSIANPLWVPVLGRGVVSAAPNSFTTIEIPLVETGEVSGRVEFADGRPIAGARVFAHNLDTGSESSVVTFSDGTFYLMGIRPGRNEVYIGDGHLRGMGASSTPVEFFIGPGQLSADGLVIMVLR